MVRDKSVGILNQSQKKQHSRYKVPESKQEQTNPCCRLYKQLIWKDYHKIYKSNLNGDRDHGFGICGLIELWPTSGDLTRTFSLQKPRPFPIAFGGDEWMLLGVESPGCNHPRPGIKATSVFPSCLKNKTLC